MMDPYPLTLIGNPLGPILQKLCDGHSLAKCPYPYSGNTAVVHLDCGIANLQKKIDLSTYH